MLSARVLIGLCVVSASAAADDFSAAGNYYDMPTRTVSQPRLTLFDGTLTLTPVKSGAALLPVKEFDEPDQPTSTNRSSIQQMSFTTESDLRRQPMEPGYYETDAPRDCSVAVTQDADANNRLLLRRLQAQDRQIAALQSEFCLMSEEASVTGRPSQQPTTECGESCGAGCGAGCRINAGWLDERCDCYPRIIGGLEIPFLRSRLSGAIPVFNVGAAAERMIDSDFEPSVRYRFEVQNSDSFSVRARHFRYNRSFPFEQPYQPAQLGIEISQTDVEAVFRHRLQRWSFDVSGGFEHARLEYGSDLPTAVGVGTAAFEGVGPVFAMNAAHDIGDTNLSWFCGVRASILMGRIKNGTLLVNLPRAEIQDETMHVYSNQIGVQWSPKLFRNMGLTVRGAWETQYWANTTFSDDSLGIGSNLNLTGPTISAQLEY